MHARDLPPVETSPLAGDDGVRWHALKVYPQRERAAKAWLLARGVYSFYPTRKIVRHVRGRALESERLYLPGYVFARFSGAPLWHRIISKPERRIPRMIHDVIRLHNGEPGMLHERSLQQLFAMRATEGELDARFQHARRLRKSDRATIRSGIYEGQEIEIIEIKAGKARFKIYMFGAEIETAMDVGRLEKVERP